jgi:ribonuclease P protein component
VQIVALMDPSAVPPRVAFAIGRATGGSVVRNRIRRRCRAALRELAGSGALPPGWYLVSARSEAATVPFEDLRAALAEAVASVGRRA